MNVPFIDLKKTAVFARDEVLPFWEGALDRCEFVGGPTVAKLEGALKDHCKVNHALTCANGTDAILIGLQAMGVKPGDKVALPNMTFWATYESIAQLGATPVPFRPLIFIGQSNLIECVRDGGVKDGRNS